MAPKKAGTKSVTRSTRAGLIFPVGRIHRHLKKGNYCKRVGGVAPVFLACVLEYLITEILELSSAACVALKGKRIKPRHIKLAIIGDSEFQGLLKNITIAAGGVRPGNIHPALIKKKTEDM